ncbi:MAG: RsmB/NOP family class I SAM-dependent RNA methyltransferase [Magnetococcales bacterium]|nr:RsmB/NOP family class I SAM-dependent RNA methyltransferase [Magnetococcales bacterium]
MRPEAAIQQSGQLLQDIFTAQHGADQLIDSRFRQQRMGGRERKLVSELIYSVLRHRRRLQVCFQSVQPDYSPTPTELAGLAWAEGLGWTPLQTAQFLGLDQTKAEARFADIGHFTFAERLSLPDWMWVCFVRQWGEEGAERLALALNEKPSVDLRVNRRLLSRDQAQKQLLAAGIPSAPTPYSPDGLRLNRRYLLKELACFKSGALEIQDEGSQLISQLLKPQPGNLVIDLCAGAGGKSLHLADLMNDAGQVIATDNDSRRLGRLKARQQRARVRSIQSLPIRHEGDPRLKRWSGSADGVLVDAPCSGSGTLRRNPEIKWRLTPDQVTVYQQRQGALLSAGARLVKKGGRLVYATCSLLNEENQDIVADFQKENGGFKLLHIGYELEGLPHDGPFLTLRPDVTETDGFFAAVFQKKS